MHPVASNGATMRAGDSDAQRAQREPHEAAALAEWESHGTAALTDWEPGERRRRGAGRACRTLSTRLQVWRSGAPACK
ncbi:unnamed protein product [Urochloa humidicola]